MATEDSIPAVIAHRARLRILPVPASEVEVITDDQTCNQAARQFRKAVFLTARAPAVDVVRVGTRYVVVDATFKSKKGTPLVVLDEQFNVLYWLVDSRLVVPMVDAATVDAWIACFEEKVITGDIECPNWWRVREVVGNPHEYEPATVDAVLDGLGRLALTTDDQELQFAAIDHLRKAGERPNHHPGVVDRLEALYWQSDVPEVRGWAADMRNQAETSKVLDFLEALAKEPDDLAMYAIIQLETSWVVAEGYAVLRRLYDQGSVTNAGAKRRLSYLVGDPPERN
jgi:hypothetical protein